ncbi:hypothetical protein HO675_06855 [Streptococcus suis]|nr:hypothetical protein [Streptococcus suis]
MEGNFSTETRPVKTSICSANLPKTAERDTDFYDIVLLDHKEDGNVESLVFTETLVQNEDGTRFPAVVFVAKDIIIYGVVYVETAKGPDLVNEGPVAFEGGLVSNQAPKQAALS